MAKKIAKSANSNLMHPGLAEPADFLSIPNFDLWYFCSLLIYKDVQYLIWKIWFISVWILKPKAVLWLLAGFMLGQSTLFSYHTEANGCIFFAAGVFEIHWACCKGIFLWHRPLLTQISKFAEFLLSAVFYFFIKNQSTREKKHANALHSMISCNIYLEPFEHNLNPVKVSLMIFEFEPYCDTYCQNTEMKKSLVQNHLFYYRHFNISWWIFWIRVLLLLFATGKRCHTTNCKADN